MNQSDLEGIVRSGARARTAGVSFFENPHYFSDAPLGEWHAIASAWASGWLREDAGRDENIARLMRVPVMW